MAQAGLGSYLQGWSKRIYNSEKQKKPSATQVRILCGSRTRLHVRYIIPRVRRNYGYDAHTTRASRPCDVNLPLLMDYVR